jgi:hypothetical protein
MVIAEERRIVTRAGPDARCGRAVRWVRRPTLTGVCPSRARSTQTLRAASPSVMVANCMGDLRFSSSQVGGLHAFRGVRRGRFIVALGWVLLSAACGHPATEAECRIILERIVELELKSQKVNDPAEIAKRRNESLGLAGDGGRSDLLDGCVGRHITDRALVCVQNAETASDITENCLQ